MTSRIVHLHEAAGGEYGGKATGLARLFSCGVPVPQGAALSPKFVEEIVRFPDNKDSHEILARMIGTKSGRRFAVRSSALNEDGEQNSFAGIYDTILNVESNSSAIIQAISRIFEGQTSSRVSLYKAERGIASDINPQLGIVIQEMIAPTIAGVAFTSALATNGCFVMLLECVQGLGDKLVNGESIPTRIEIPFSNGEPDIGHAITTGTPLNMIGIDRLVSAISQARKTIEKDLDIEWAIDKDGSAWLLQARPITKPVLVPAQTITQSVPASSGYVKGMSFVIKSSDDLDDFPDKAVLVAEVTDIHFLPAMHRASAIITEEGGILSHAAIVAREIGIPCIVGYSNARQLFPTGSALQVDGTSGIVHNESNPGSTHANLARHDVDWGAAYLFENIIPMQVGEVIGLFNPTPNGLALHLPVDISPDADESLEIFSRKTFGTSPRRYQSDKYLWYFEWERFQNNPFFINNFHKSLGVIAALDQKILSAHYDSVVESSVAVKENFKAIDDFASDFLCDESLLTSHFLLTMLIPEGYAIKTLYTKSQPILSQYPLKFSDLLSGAAQGQNTDSELKKISEFSLTLSLLRNSIYERLLDKGIMHSDYFDDRNDRAMQAINAMGAQCSPDDDPVTVFYDNIRKVPAFNLLADPQKKMIYSDSLRIR